MNYFCADSFSKMSHHFQFLMSKRISLFILLSQVFIVKAQDFEFSIARKLNDSTEVNQFNKDGILAANQSDGWMLAMSYHSKAYQLAKEINYPKGEAESLRHLAVLEAKAANRKEKALNYFLEEINIRESMADLKETAISYELLGDFFRLEIQDFEHATGYYHQALMLLKKNITSTEKIQFKIAECYNAMEKINEATATYAKIAEYYVAQNQIDKAMELYLDIAKLANEQKEYDKAIGFIKNVQKLHTKTQHSSLQTKFEESITLLKQKKADQEVIALKWQISVIAGFGLMFLVIFWIWRTQQKNLKTK